MNTKMKVIIRGASSVKLPTVCFVTAGSVSMWRVSYQVHTRTAKNIQGVSLYWVERVKGGGQWFTAGRMLTSHSESSAPETETKQTTKSVFSHFSQSQIWFPLYISSASRVTSSSDMKGLTVDCEQPTTINSCGLKTNRKFIIWKENRKSQHSARQNSLRHNINSFQKHRLDFFSPFLAQNVIKDGRLQG